VYALHIDLIPEFAAELVKAMVDVILCLRRCCSRCTASDGDHSGPGHCPGYGPPKLRLSPPGMFPGQTCSVTKPPELVAWWISVMLTSSTMASLGLTVVSMLFVAMK
jgi:hypothetical protein